MKESETFDEFNAKPSKIVNSSFNLGEPVPQPKIVKMILRPFPERFRPKVVAIEEYQDLNFLSIEELVGNLQTYDANHCQDKKSKDIALVFFKSTEDNSNGESDCDSNDAKFEELFVKKLRKLWKNKKNNLEKNFQNNKAPNKSKFVPKSDKNLVKGSSKPI